MTAPARGSKARTHPLERRQPRAAGEKHEAPFHVVHLRVERAGRLEHMGYKIMANNNEFLVSATDGPARLRRHQAYAIAALLNKQRDFRTWAEKFEDPYV